MIIGMVKGRSFSILGLDRDYITTGSVGLKIGFVFDDEWNGLAKTVVFQNGTIVKTDTVQNGECTVPFEVLVNPGSKLRIGIRGVNGVDVVIPTIYAEVTIYQGTGDTVSPGGSYTPSEIEQIQGEIGDLSELETMEKSSLVGAVNELFERPQGIPAELKLALLQIAQKVAYIDSDGDSYYTDLYNALYVERYVVSINAVFDPGQTVIYNTDSLDSLRQYLTVTLVYSDESTAETDIYDLFGSLTPGTCTITVSFSFAMKSTTFEVEVVALPPVFHLDSPTSDADYDTQIELFDVPKSFTILCEFTFNNYNWSGTKSLFGHAAFRFGYTSSITDYIDGSVNERAATRYGALLLYPPGTTPALGTWVVGRTSGSQTRRFAIRYDCMTRKIECFIDGDDDRAPPNTKSWYIVPSEVIQPSGTTVLLNKDSSGSTANEFEIYLGLLPDTDISDFLEGGNS